MKDRLINFRVPETLYQEYKKFCDEGSFAVSKRLRKMMESDLQKWYKYKEKKDQEING